MDKENTTPTYTSIKYKIKFFTDWHCGSGLAAGADVDALVIKDSDGLPYIPGKTIKGLVRHALEEVLEFKGKNLQEKVKDCFGFFDGRQDSMKRGKTFFKNAELSVKERNAIIKDGLTPYLFRTVSSTAIDPEGVAVSNSLRRIEVTVPCTLEGEILNIDSELEEYVKDALSFIKRVGIDRNRGLGRCSFLVVEMNDGITSNKE